MYSLSNILDKPHCGMHLQYCTLKLTTVLEAANLYCIYVVICIKIKVLRYIYNVCSLNRYSKCVVIDKNTLSINILLLYVTSNLIKSCLISLCGIVTGMCDPI